MTTTSRGRRVAGCGLLLLGACGTPMTGMTGDESSSGAAESTTGVVDPATDGSGVIQTLTSETDPGSTGSGTDETVTSGDTTADVCPGLVADLGAALTAGARCDLLLTIDGLGALTGWATACVDEPAESYVDGKTAAAALSCCDGAQELSPEGTSPFVMYLPPFPPESPGGLGLVSNHIGGPVFDGSIGIDEPGTISLPARWSPPASLGVGADCPPTAFTFTALAGYHAGLTGGLADDIILMLEASIGATVLPAALAAGATLERTVVVGYESQYMSSDTTHVVLFELSAP